MAAVGWMLVGAAVALGLEAIARNVWIGINDLSKRRWKGGGRG